MKTSKISELNISKIRSRIEELRNKYNGWKEEHPDNQDEDIINQFLLLKAELAERKKPLVWRDTHLDLEAKMLEDIAKIKTAANRFILDEKIMSESFEDGDYAPLNPSNENLGEAIKLENIEPLFKSFGVSNPISWLVGGIVIHPTEGTKNDFDVLVSIPSEEELKRIFEIRIKRMFPSELQNRMHLLFEKKGGMSPFSDYLPLYRLIMERIPNAKITKMAEITLRTQNTEKQEKEANKAAKEDKITFGKFFLPMKPKRSYVPGQAQTLDYFLSLWNEDQFPVYSSMKADGLNLECHISKDGKAKVYTEDGIDETSSFPETIEEAKKLAPGHDIILLGEGEWWENGQHYPREVASGQIHKIEPNEKGIIVSVYDIVYYDKDIHQKSLTDRLDFLAKLNFPQKTESPDPKFNWNLISHIKNKNIEELKKETEKLSKLKGSEGNVAKQASSSYDLKNQKANVWLKFHNSTIFVAIVINSIETKTKGVYNLEYGILVGKKPVKEKDIRDVDGKEILYVGKTFSTTKNLPKGSKILIEAETVNITYNVKNKTFDLTGWAPRMMGPTDKKAQAMDEIEQQAIKDRVFQAKIIDKDGKTHYLPGKSGEEVRSK